MHMINQSFVVLKYRVCVLQAAVHYKYSGVVLIILYISREIITCAFYTNIYYYVYYTIMHVGLTTQILCSRKLVASNVP